MSPEDPQPALVALRVDHELPTRLLGVLTRATDDRSAVAGWLRKYANSHTFIRYLKEVDRLLLWADDRKLALRSMTVEDVADFKAWLLNPGEQWCSGPGKTPARNLKNGSPNPAWRPFIQPLTDIKPTLTVLYTCFSYLCNVGYIHGNVFLAAKGPTPKRAKQVVERYLEPAVLAAFLEYLDRLPRDSKRAEQHFQRSRFLFTVLFSLGLRQAEMAAATTRWIKLKHGKVWLEVHGKGGKIQDVPINAECALAIREYRESLGLPRWPAVGEDVPLLQKICGGNQGLTRKAVYQVSKQLFQDAADSVEDQAIAAVLRQASTHWMRHTCASAMLDKVGLLATRDHLRHSSVAVTECYIHTDLVQRHVNTEAHQLRPKADPEGSV